MPDPGGRAAGPPGAALARLLPPLAVGVLALTVGATLAVAGDTLGYDFRAYWAAGSRVLAGQPLYDAAAAVAGPSGVFLYPPPFALAMLPLARLPEAAATWVWTALILAAFVAGTAVLPVSRTVRWLVVLLAGLSWPFAYAVKLGQVGPVLYLLFAIGWRWLDRPSAVGVAGAVGAAAKVQPGLVLVWALLRRRWAAVALGLGALAAMALVSVAVLGAGVWADYIALLARVSDPITTPHNFTLGAVAYQAGLPRDAAALVQGASNVLAAILFAYAALRLPGEPSYLAAVVVSQLVSPVVWDHYAMLLLLPVAWLLGRRQWWAALIPLSTCVALVGQIPPAVYPAMFWLTLLAVVAAGRRDGPADAGAPQVMIAHA